MLDGTFNTSDSMVFETKVMIGSWRVYCDWEVDREMSGVPGRTTQSRGATGELKNVTPYPDVTLGRPGPWNPAGLWPPVAGMSVTIDVRAEGGNEWFRQFTGIVDKVMGGSLGLYDIDITDRVDRFDRMMYDYQPLQKTMPGRKDWEDNRHTNLHQNAFFELALMHAGFYVAAPSGENVTLGVSNLGTTMPTRGDTATAGYNYTAWQSTYDSPDGWGVGNTDFGTYWECTRNARENGFMVFSNAIGTGMTNGYVLSLKFIEIDNATDVNIRVFADRSVKVNLGPNETTVITMPPEKVGRVIWLTRTPNANGKQGDIRLYSWTSQNGLAVSGVVTTAYAQGRVAAVATGVPLGARPGPVCVQYPTKEPNYSWQPNAYIEPHWSVSGMPASRAISGMSANDLLTALSKATATHVGIDEDGKCAVIPFFARAGKAPVARMVDLDDVYDEARWSSDLKDAASQVIITYNKPECRTRKLADVQVYQGSTDTLQGGDSRTMQFGPSSDTDWLLVDTSADQIVGSYGSGALANLGRNNVFMASVAVKPAQAGGDYGSRTAYTSEYDCSMRRVDARTWEYTQKAPTGQEVTTACPADVKWLTPFLWRQATPIIRARGTTKWTEKSVFSPMVNNDAPTVKINAGDWAGDNVQLVANSMGNFLANGAITLERMRVRPDPRRRVCDPIQVESSAMRTIIGGVITGMRTTFTAGAGFSQVIDLTVTTHLQGSATWTDVEMDRKRSDSSGSSWRSVETNRKWSAFEQTPLA